MYLLPLVFDNCCVTRPSRILNQHFGVDLDVDDFLTPVHCELLRCPALQYQPWRNLRTMSSKLDHKIKTNEDKFQIHLDVQQFKPDEITVKVTGKNTITVEGKHEEKRDEHGYISRHFVRRYILPEGHDTNNAVSSLSSDGVLSITAPRINQKGDRTRSIPIQQTDVASRAVENKKEEEKKECKKD